MSCTFEQLLFALLGGFALNLVLLVHSQDHQSGFISIDCGLETDSSYPEKTTGLDYISDATFIDTGESKSILLGDRDDYLQPYWYVRCFPEGVRNCYKINVTRGNKYLIRASFVYGNYDGQDKIPEFELHLGPDLWDTVSFRSASGAGTHKELIHVPPRNYIHVCLVNTDSGVPFISAIELRPLSNESYQTVRESSLALVSRYDTGQGANSRAYRYPFDIYDRFWTSYHDFDNYWRQLNTSSTISSESDDRYQLPSVVMSTAATPKNPSDDSLRIILLPNINAEYCSYLHFAELERADPNQSRLQQIILNGKRIYGAFAPPSLHTYTIFSASGLNTFGQYNISITRAKNSTLPPILNAFEIYMVKNFTEAETNQEDVDAITNIKATYKIKSNWQGDPCSPQLYSWEGLNCSLHKTNQQHRIISLNLSSSALTGEIAHFISNLTMIETLDLSNNNLIGSVPEFLSTLPNLSVLNLEKNNLTGSVPVGLIQRRKDGLLSLSLCENPNLSDSQQISCDLNKKGNISSRIAVIALYVLLITLLSIALALFGMGFEVYVMGFGIFEMGFRRKRPHEEMTNFKPNRLLECEGQRFAYSEIVKITNDFASIIGRGGFGKVYLGTLTNETQVAVKLLNSSSRQGSKEFKNEVELLMRARHRNLVSLVGYCNEWETMALVYEYVANGNLQQHLSADVTQDVLTWKERLGIAVDTARGLEYLHNGCKPPIVHRDLKTSNILLNEKLQAKIGDFGLSKVLSTESATHVSTVAKGTFGYLDPQYCSTGQLNKKSDVYSFGIVLLELITGRAAIARDEEDVPIHICEWMCPKFESMEIESIVDSRLQGSYLNSSARKAIEIARACASSTAIQRPDITVVHNDLKECLEIEMPFEITEIVERYDASSSSSVTMTSYIESQTNTSSLGMLHEISNSLH
ncbi:hypothetical protein ACE6H2_009953 [Prunus campanulata]